MLTLDSSFSLGGFGSTKHKQDLRHIIQSNKQNSVQVKLCTIIKQDSINNKVTYLGGSWLQVEHIEQNHQLSKHKIVVLYGISILPSHQQMTQ